MTDDLDGPVCFMCLRPEVPVNLIDGQWACDECMSEISDETDEPVK